MKLHIKPTYFQGTYPPEHTGEVPVSVVGLDNGGCIKIYCDNLEQSEAISNLIVFAPDLLQGLKDAVSWLKELGYGKTPNCQEFKDIITKAEKGQS